MDEQTLASAVKAFQAAWLRADAEGKSGHRTEAGIRAAAPIIAAPAWDEGYEACVDDTEHRSGPPGPCGPSDPTPNPFHGLEAGS